MSNLKEILINKKICKSVWFMRQAGRYLPEFRDIRSKNEDFINLCLNSKLSSDITLQPIKRFNLDSAIIFSDILLVPFALGQKISFIKNQGPKLSNFNLETFLDVNEDQFIKTLTPVYKAIELTRKNLNKDKSLICFIGAPWTLLVYMLNLKDFEGNLSLDKFHKVNSNIKIILKKLNKFLCIHIQSQVEAGADVVQVFDSWAGIIPEVYLKDFCFNTNFEIIKFCKSKNIPNICFPKGIKDKYKDFNKFVKPDGINIDYHVDPDWAKKNLKDVVIQGGANPRILLEKEEKMLEVATKYIQTFKDIPYVFNLGHGLLPETDPDKVEKLVKFYRNFNE